ncbi:MAG TPA: guanine permease, partial [Spirochaetaceae bacterium]|nr:guanine permease [Spirochaetaceae bacterium]
MERLFRLKQHGTSAKTEYLAGLTTFLTMVYILIVNPGILSAAKMDWGSVFTATALSAAIATLVMGLWGNLPFALAPGMGLNAFLAFTVCGMMGYPWQFALAAVFIEGIIFIFLTAFNIREEIVASIPDNLKKAIAVGIGLFIAFIGMQNAGIIAPNPSTAVELHTFKSAAGDYAPFVALIGLIITSILVVKKVPAALLIGIALTTLVGIPFGVTVWNPIGLRWAPPEMTGTFFGCFDGFRMIQSSRDAFDFMVVMFTFLFVDMFDTLGTLIG